MGNIASFDSILSFGNSHYFEVLMRLTCAVIIGGIIGLERSGNNQDAGLRTHVLVCLGAAGMGYYFISITMTLLLLGAMLLLRPLSRKLKHKEGKFHYIIKIKMKKREDFAIVSSYVMEHGLHVDSIDMEDDNIFVLAITFQDEYTANQLICSLIEKEEILEVAESANFGSVITPNEIRNEIDTFIFLEKRDIKGTYAVPDMVTLNKNRKYLDNILRKHIIKIAVIPFSCTRMLEFPVTIGAAFGVEYTEWHKQHAKERALELLCEAIEKGANIVVFPEFICSPEIQDAISQKLSAMYDSSAERLNDLLLVVAGSGWTQDSNNVSKIYSYNGIHLGDQYKYSSFIRKNGKQSMVEGLSNPGGATTIIKIPGIGNIQVGICRDISESTFANQLARLFSPVFLLIPAWSGSVERGFKTQLRTIVSENHTTIGVLCNCCEAFGKKSFRKNIGIIVTPYKNKTIVDGKETYIGRNEEICAECLERGCIFMCNFNFRFDNAQNGITAIPVQLSI